MPARHGGGVAFVRVGAMDGNVQNFQAYTAEGVEPGILISVTVVPDVEDRQTFNLAPRFDERAFGLLAAIAGGAGIERDDQTPAVLADQVQLYDRLVHDPCEPTEAPSADALTAVALAMTSGNHVEPEKSTDIPAVMTYFGQFLAHDMTNLQWSQGKGAWVNERAGHSLNFDTVLAPPDPACVPHGPWDCTAGVCLGETTRQDDFRDLPRNTQPQGKACVSDKRNDSNLALAQMHVLLTRFHHSVQRHNPTMPMDKVRALTVKHLQAVVFFDYLRTIADEGVWQDVHDNGRSLVRKDITKGFFVPIEFAAAAFRFGHSMVRDIYSTWGDEDQFMYPDTFLRFVHDPPNLQSDLTEGRLGSMWAHDWRRFSRLAGDDRMIRAARIDLNIAYAFRDLASGHFAQKTPPQPGATLNLARHTLERHYKLRLPSGQVLAQLAGVQVMSESEVLGTGYADIALAATQAGFCTAAPLWYYILREAEHFHDGRRLGPLGSRIVCETLHAAIENSADSILKDMGDPAPVFDFTPTMPRVTTGGLFSIEDIIALAYPTP